MNSEGAAQHQCLTIFERTEGHYEVQEVEFGKVYRWCPECIDIECECGERLTLTSYSTPICPRCEANHVGTIREELNDGRLDDRILHPWRYDARDREDAGLPC